MRKYIFICISLCPIFMYSQSLHSEKWNMSTCTVWKQLVMNFQTNHFYIGVHDDGRTRLDDVGNYFSRTKFYSSNASRNSKEYESGFKYITGSYPSMTETDFQSYAINRTSDDEKKEQKKCLVNYLIQYHNLIGGLITLSCHMANPWWYEEKNNDYAADFRYISSQHPNVVAEILDGKIKLNSELTVKEKFDEQLEEFIQMLKQLKDLDGNSIPVVVRLFHEASGSWFWWGDQHCSNQEYKELFRYTVGRITSECNNVMIAYTPDSNWNSMDVKDKFMNRYPGNGYVDIVGMDNYGINESNISETVHQLRLLFSFAQQNRKVAALTETGNLALKIPNWFTICLEPCLTASGVRLAYVQIYGPWSSVDGFFFPYKKNSVEAKDFRKFYKNKSIIKIHETKF